MSKKIIEKEEKYISLYEEYKAFDIKYPYWGKQEHYIFSKDSIDSNQLLNKIIKEFEFKKQIKENVILYIAGAQIEERQYLVTFFTRLLSKIWGTEFRYENLCFSNEETLKAIETARPGETIVEDEHGANTIGDLNKILNEKVFSAGETARQKNLNFIFCSKEELEREQFITLEIKNTWKNKKTNKPLNVECLVNTPEWYYQHMKVPRGVIFVPVPEEESIKLYDKRKNESFKNIETKYGVTFSYHTAQAKELFERLKDFLIEKNKNGEWVAKKGISFKTICLLGKNGVKGFGSGRTNEFRVILISLTSDLANDYCIKLNKKLKKVVK